MKFHFQIIYLVEDLEKSVVSFRISFNIYVSKKKILTLCNKAKGSESNNLAF